MLEITCRTIGGQFLLRPSDDLTERFYGLLGRALALYPVELHAFAVLSNHWHCLITPADPAAARDFMRYMHGNLARAINDILGREGPVWHRASLTPIADEAAQVERLRYVLAHGAKEGLVGTPLDWPGPHAARALAGREHLSGTWIDRDKLTRHRRAVAARRALAAATSQPQPDLPTEDFATTYAIDLAPIPAWRHLTDADRRTRVTALLADIVSDARAAHPQPLGVAAVLTQSPTTMPLTPLRRTPAPRCHASTTESYVAFSAARRAFLDAHRTGGLALRASRPAPFPRQAFPPAVAALRWPTTILLMPTGATRLAARGVT